MRRVDLSAGSFFGGFIRGGVVLPGKRIRGNFKHLLDEIETLPSSMRYSEEIEQYAGRVNSYLGLLRQYHAFHFTRRMFDCHPRLKLFLKWNPETLEKVTSRKRIDALVCRSVNKEAARLFHSQFRRGNRMAMFLKADCYRQVYLRRYRTLILVAVERHPVY